MPRDDAREDQAAPGTATVTRKPTHPLRRYLAIAAGLVVALLVVLWVVNYLLVGQYFIGTDDAYIAADTSMIAGKISGYVTAVPVSDNQIVKAGDLLASIDPRDYQVSLTSAQADIASAQAAIGSDHAQVSLQQAKIAQAQAALRGDAARVAFAAQNQRRYASLSGSGASPKQSADQANTDLATAQAQQAADQAALLGANRQIGVLDATLAQSQASLAQAQARAQQALLDFSHAQIRAPFGGVVGNKTVVVGDYLQPGTQIMALVPLGHVYVTANYKETQITRMLRGQKVTIAVDGFPNLKVTGTVNSIAPSSGQEFALLPPDNATGNFTKIVQRVPVKIDINLNPDLIGKLRPGMSVEPSIDTRQGH